MRKTKKKLLERRVYLLGKGRISLREHNEILAIQARFSSPKPSDEQLISWAQNYITNKKGDR
ncbi:MULTISPECIES: hypothetical protein [Pseudanabaena]|uniref:Uncharacterized protein n=1 Tax=Pseudanabaena catenata USMAC16 TaxID=1855837 RepID=A0A9X4M9A2_9CYAN|nr:MULTISPECIES: hypothetical protein [Pseudanabaena]MDG3494980.1 hypothetical protein [Pseudanabaena catenata USMAC16]